MPGNEPSDPGQESRQNALSHLLEEGRMLLPGIQALFGFQLIAVFNDGFQQRLAPCDRILHFIAIGMIATCVVLVLSPAAYHRQCEPGHVSRGFLTWAGRAMAIAMIPLGLALTLDLDVVGVAIVGSHALPTLIAAVACLSWIGLWFVLPAVKRHAAERAARHRTVGA